MSSIAIINMLLNEVLLMFNFYVSVCFLERKLETDATILEANEFFLLIQVVSIINIDV